MRHDYSGPAVTAPHSQISSISTPLEFDNLKIRPSSQFLIVPVPFLYRDGQLHLELQASIGMQQWLSNFDSVTLAAPLLTDTDAAKLSGIVWVPAAGFGSAAQFVPLPRALSVKSFLKNLSRARAQIAECIDKSRYLQFGISYLFGDWAGVGAEVAIQKRRKYGVHMDKVEYRAILDASRNESLSRRLKAQVLSPLTRLWHERLIRHASLSLCHGNDCFEAYGSLSSASYLVHDIHIEVDAAEVDRLRARKQDEILSGKPLTLCYTGRMVEDKAPRDWVRAVASAYKRGAAIKAVWLGDGPLRDEMLALIAELGVSEAISLPGFESDRQRVMNLIGSSHLMPFTHITPESPRCLLEALMHSTPIVGYETAFSKDLVARNGGGMHVESGDFEALAEMIIRLDKDRKGLSQLVGNAALDGKQFSSREVFRHRSELIKDHL
ncbi:MAG: glycosyltransferase [Candidatus Binatus sp.]